MIVSHKHKFIFLKTKKTAGTAVELALIPICGAQDIVTPTDPSEEVEAARNGLLPRNFVRRGPSTWLPKLRTRIFKPHKLDKTNFYHHMPASLVKDRIGDDVWNSYFKFTIERNPWDRQISYYFYMKSINPTKFSGMDFSTFLRSRSGNLKNTDIYLCNDVVGINFFIRYETLHQDLVTLENRLGQKLQPLLAINVTKSKDKRPYQQFYNHADRALIEKIYWREILLFGYDFDSGVSTKFPDFGARVPAPLGAFDF